MPPVIKGVVNAFREPRVCVTIRGSNGGEQEIEAVVDTGFNGSLTLPPALIASLDLPFRQRGQALLADGSESLFDIYEATMLWDGVLRRVLVDEVDTTPLLGMTLLYGYELMVRVVDGGDVVIRHLNGI